MWGTAEAAAARLLASGLVAICIVKHRLLLSSGWASSMDTTADTLASYWRPFEALLCRSLWMRPTAIKRPRQAFQPHSLLPWVRRLQTATTISSYLSPKKPRRPPSFTTPPCQSLSLSLNPLLYGSCQILVASTVACLCISRLQGYSFKAALKVPTLFFSSEE